MKSQKKQQNQTTKTQRSQQSNAGSFIAVGASAMAVAAVGAGLYGLYKLSQTEPHHAQQNRPVLLNLLLNPLRGTHFKYIRISPDSGFFRIC